MQSQTIHEGRNVKRIREILGVKQEALAAELGLSQQAISALEQKEALDKDLLEKIAAVLKVPAEAIRSFNDETAINIISNTFHDNAVNMNYQCTFNPIEKMIELYEALLESERDKLALYKRFFDKE